MEKSKCRSLGENGQSVGLPHETAALCQGEPSSLTSPSIQVRMVYACGLHLSAAGPPTELPVPLVALEIQLLERCFCLVVVLVEHTHAAACDRRLCKHLP